jgi:hypothetical protein
MIYCHHIATDLHTACKRLGAAVPQVVGHTGACVRFLVVISITKLQLIGGNLEKTFQVASIIFCFSFGTLFNDAVSKLN